MIDRQYSVVVKKIVEVVVLFQTQMGKGVLCWMPWLCSEAMSTLYSK